MASLHIGVDGRELVGRPTGVGRYLTGILQAWADDPDFPHAVSIFVPTTPTVAAPGRMVWSPVPARAAGTWWEQTLLPRALDQTRVDVLFAPGYTAPLRARCPSVVVIHDVSFCAHPEWFRWREGLRRRWLTRASARRAHRVLTDSEFSATEIVRWLGIPRPAIGLAPPAVDPVTAVVTPTDARDPTVLFVGSLFNRRHIPLLIEAFARVTPAVPASRLVLVGDNRTHPRVDPRAVAGRHGVGDRVTWHDYVSDARLAELYGRASVFAFLSDYEGFGLPPLEAIAHGVPPVLLDTPVSHEVYGRAGTLVTPDPAAVADALGRLLGNADLRRERLADGQRLLERYTWDRAAGVVRQALEEAVR